MYRNGDMEGRRTDRRLSLLEAGGRCLVEGDRDRVGGMVFEAWMDLNLREGEGGSQMLECRSWESCVGERDFGWKIDIDLHCLHKGLACISALTRFTLGLPSVAKYRGKASRGYNERAFPGLMGL